MHAETFPRQAMPQDEGLGRAVAWAVGLHVLIALLLILSPLFTWDRERLNPAGATSMEASLEVSAADQRAVRQALSSRPEPMPAPVESMPEPVPEDTAPPPQPIVERSPQDARVVQQSEAQERIPVPDTTDQEEASREAIALEKARQEQEAKRRQEQIDLSERQRQERAEQQRRLAAQQEEEKQKRLADEAKKKEEADRQQKLADIRRQREQAARQTQLAEQRAQQLREAQARQAPASSRTAAQAGESNAASGQASGPTESEWSGAMLAAIERQWIRPPNTPPDMICPVRIRLLPGGEVMSAEVQPNCNHDQAIRDSVERAVLRASPLPYAGFERVAKRDFTVRFRPSN